MKLETPTMSGVLANPSTSYWLIDALTSALKRDPVDAVRDAATLAQLLEARLDNMKLETTEPLIP